MAASPVEEPKSWDIDEAETESNMYFDLDTADNQTLNQYAAKKIGFYRAMRKNEQQKDVWRYFCIDFSDWTEPLFLRLESKHTTDLKRILMTAGVVISYEQHKRVAAQIIQAMDLYSPFRSIQAMASTAGTVLLKTESITPTVPTAHIIPVAPNQLPPAALPSSTAVFVNPTPRFAIGEYHASTYSKELTNLAKSYVTEDKGKALQFFHSNLRHLPRQLDVLCQALVDNFEGLEFARNLVMRYQIMTIKSVMMNHPEKTLLENLNIYLEKIRSLNLGMPESYQTNEMIQTKVLLDARAIPGFKIACSKPAITLQGLISDLQSSAAVEDQEHQQASAVGQVLFTDRKYKGDDRRHKHSRTSHSPGDQTKNCIVCNKTGCWSTKHSKEDRDKAWKRYKKEHAKLAYLQYLADHEGTESISTSSGSESESGEYGNGTAFYTQLGEVDGDQLIQMCETNAAIHAFTGSTAFLPPREEADEVNKAGQAFLSSSRYGSDDFKGIVIDTGASAKSTCGLPQFTALKKIVASARLDTSRAGEFTVSFGPGKNITPIGCTTVETPLGTITFHVLDVDTPFLLSLTDLDRSGFHFDNQLNRLCKGNAHIPVVRKFGHAFLLWGQNLVTYLTTAAADAEAKQSFGWLTDVEVKRLHRRFGHPSALRLIKLLERAGQDFDIQAVHELTKYCGFCQKFGQAPRRFRFSLKDDALNAEFNYELVIDIFYLKDLDSKDKPVLHVVDNATRYAAAAFLETISARAVWEQLKRCWIDTYVGPPQFITTDAGAQFTSIEFKQLSSTLAITVRAIPTEAHHSIGKVERYHGPVKRAYNILALELKGQHITRDGLLQMAVKAVNDSAGPDGYTPTLLVYGTYPRFTATDPVVSTSIRAKAMNKAMAEVVRLHSERAVRDALNTRNGPKTDDIHDTIIGSEVLVWRENGIWDGPFKLLSMEGENCIIQLPGSISTFRSTSVKPFYKNADDVALVLQKPDMPVDAVVPPEPNLMLPPQPVRRGRGRPGKQVAFITEKENNAYELAEKLRANGRLSVKSPPFAESRRAEVSGLIKRGVFDVVDKEEAVGRVFRARFVDDIKYNQDGPYEKSRLVVQAFNDQGKQNILTQAPTVQRASQRLLLCLAPSLLTVTGYGLYLRDISQAYIQSNTTLARLFFVVPPKECNIPNDKILAIRKPLYGIPEAGKHWFRTYHDHHTQKLGLKAAASDPCLLFSRINQLPTILALQTDDTLFCSNDKFRQLEQSALNEAKFPAKPLLKLSQGTPLDFNGGHIELLDGNVISLTQQKYCDRIELVNLESNLKEQFIKQRALGAYVASLSQPEASHDLSFAAQHNSEPTIAAAKLLNSRLTWQQDNGTRGLKFIPLTLDGIKLFAFVDASFARNSDLSSQLGVVIVICNTSKRDEQMIIKGNIVHWTSIKCKRVTRSVLASELYAMSQGLDMAIGIQSAIADILGFRVPLVMATDSHSLYDCLVKLGTTAEKRLMIDIASLRQSYERREITELLWIAGEDNPADAMTKTIWGGALPSLVDTNELTLRTKGWVER